MSFFFNFTSFLLVTDKIKTEDKRGRIIEQRNIVLWKRLKDQSSVVHVLFLSIRVHPSINLPHDSCPELIMEYYVNWIYIFSSAPSGLRHYDPGRTPGVRAILSKDPSWLNRLDVMDIRPCRRPHTCQKRDIIHFLRLFESTWCSTVPPTLDPDT